MFFYLVSYSFCLGLIGAWVAKKFAHKLGIIDVPSERSSHDRSIPKCGGIGIVIAFAVGSVILPVSSGLWLPALSIAVLSLWGGDKHCLSPAVRLISQFVCSMIFLVSFIYLEQMHIDFYALCIPLAIFIVGTSNFYNFMDGIDGIAGITGVIGFSLLYLYNTMFINNPIAGELCLVFTFSCLGFLCFNFPKAKVFLGDVGSILLGFVYACMVIIISENLVDFVILVGFLALFYLDELSTMAIRISRGDSLMVPHRRHLYQLLANEGKIDHWKISLGYGLIQMIIGFSGIFFRPLGLGGVLAVYLFYSTIFILFSVFIRKRLI